MDKALKFAHEIREFILERGRQSEEVKSDELDGNNSEV